MRKLVCLLGLGLVLAGTGCFFHEHDHDRDHNRGGAYDGTDQSYGRGAYDDDRHWNGDPWEHHDYPY